jgi:two-component system, LytTR family, response regulator
MTGPQGVASVDTGIHVGRGMRVVLFGQDADIRAKVHAAIDQSGGFVLAGECREWSACEVLLDRFVPELLIASLTQVPSGFLQKLSDSEFPIVVGLRGEDDCLRTGSGMYDSLQVPPKPEHVRSLLGRVQFEIYRRKADELSSLLERYMAAAATNEQYLSRLKVEDETQTQEIPIEHVMLIAADGNYVRVHANNRTYEIRDTMTGISAKLDPSQFARVHRSYIVNLSYVLDVEMKEGSAANVRLRGGMEASIGPNYREEFERVVNSRSRMSDRLV